MDRPIVTRSFVRCANLTTAWPLRKNSNSSGFAAVIATFGIRRENKNHLLRDSKTRLRRSLICCPRRHQISRFPQHLRVQVKKSIFFIFPRLFYLIPLNFFLLQMQSFGFPSCSFFSKELCIIPFFKIFIYSHELTFIVKINSAIPNPCTAPCLEAPNDPEYSETPTFFPLRSSTVEQIWDLRKRRRTIYQMKSYETFDNCQESHIPENNVSGCNERYAKQSTRGKKVKRLGKSRIKKLDEIVFNRDSMKYLVETCKWTSLAQINFRHWSSKSLLPKKF